MKFLLSLFLLAPLHAAVQPLFTVGADDGATTGFTRENGASNAAPGSASALDDHYYLAGNYPAPIGNLASDEPLANFEWAVTTWDDTNVIHFNATSAEANPDGILYLTLDFLWSGNSASTTSENIISVSLNGGDVFYTTPGFERYETFQTEIPTSSVTLNVGANFLTITRSGGTPNSWLAIDSVSLGVDPTALQDADADNLPLYWETLHLLSDADASDAAADPDGDTLSNLEEFNRGTHPHRADTDGDGLTDQNETLSSALDPDSDDDGVLDGDETASNPSLIDSDADGASDGWEIRTGFDPADGANTPPTWAGAIGINFRSAEVPTQGVWPAPFPQGLVPQTHWNHTSLLRQWGVPNSDPLLTGNTSDIVSPSAGVLVDAAGNTTAAAVAFTFDGCWTNRNTGPPAADLFNSYLLNDSTFPATITLAGISFSNYDLYVYLSADYLGPTGTLRLNSNPASDTAARPITIAPYRDFIEKPAHAGSNTPFYNVVRLSGLSGTSQFLELFQTSQNTGLAAIQIVDTSLDGDSDGLPDYWEFRHRLDPATHNAAADPDNDGSSNAAEFAAGTDPHNPDSDDDGLNDHAESLAGTDPNNADSDGDSLSDGDEMNHAFASDPNLADSDGDNLNDAGERRRWSDPTQAAHHNLPVPTTPNATSFLWEITDVQILRDHRVMPATSGGEERTLLVWHTHNTTQPNGWRTFQIYLRERNGRIDWLVNSSATGGFAQNGNDIWRGENTLDSGPALGFSGYGKCDTSDPLTFRVAATEGPDGLDDWTLTFSIINQSTTNIVVESVITGTTPATSIQNQTATWESRDFAGQSDFQLAHGVTLYRTTTPIHQLNGLAHCLDTDNDGMSDGFEITHGLNPNDPSDADADPDSDNLTNLQEALYQTSPNLSDSDVDGVSDDLEVLHFSNPTDGTIEPPLFAWLGTSRHDLDGNGLPDFWESHFSAFGLNPDHDSDGDGHTNLAESVLGTDPLDPNSSFHSTMEPTDTGEMLLRWPHLVHKYQPVISSTDMDFSDGFTETPTLVGDEYQLTLPAIESGEFFRLEIEDRDTDGDDLSDWVESLLGSSIGSRESLARNALRDADQNGIPDSTLPGDFAQYTSRFKNRALYSSGNYSAIPTRIDAARLLSQTTFGPTMGDIEKVRAMGVEAWLDDQIENQTTTHHQSYIQEIIEDFRTERTDLTYAYDEMNDFLHGNNVQTAFARAAVSGPDQLRQRVAYALSQVLVVSRRDAALGGNILGLTSYYDLLLDHSFGNFYDLLLAVTLDPNMGRYLSHIGNQPPAPEINRYPDENYAREVMQLFSTGLWELNQDGTQKLDAESNPIPTYSNEEITEMARVFTGLWFGAQRWGGGGWQDTHYAIPMEMHVEFHDFGKKDLLGDFVIPARPASRENAEQDVRDAIRHLVDHPNCAPFISRALIQFLITSNPTPAYVERVAGVFADNGSGTRGDLKAVVKAILLDPEARDPGRAIQPAFGLFREPVIRTIHLARLTNLNRSGKLLWWDWDNFNDQSAQSPLFSPSVFNFYRPDYAPPGTLTSENLDGPVFEITNSYTAVSFPNHLWDIANEGFRLYETYQFLPDYQAFRPYAQDHEALLDYVNLVVCAGSMSAQTRSTILKALNDSQVGDHDGKTRLALYLALMAPEGAVQK